jgi:hypothetical protein
MSGTGRVVEARDDFVPDQDKRNAQRVLVDWPGHPRICFYIEPGPRPAVGDPISWGPHHCHWPGHANIDKLTWEMDPNAPLT